jgi:uncharacterized SAM-binding protein YcdF (DUF218 family)
MFLYAGKVLFALATPLTLAIVALLVAALSGSGRRNSRLFAGFAALLLFVGSSERFPTFLFQELERPYIGTSIGSASIAQAIVVSGGYLRIETNLPRPIEMGSTADRLLCAAQLYRAGKAPLILLSGGNIPFFIPAAAPPESIAARDILEQWGIPQSAILIEGGSRSTHENAEFSYRILAAHGINRILLVTSAAHMRRAAATFRKTGLTVIPFAADFVAESPTPDLVLSWIPNATSLAGSGAALKEWAGLLVYRLRGWAI